MQFWQSLLSCTSTSDQFAAAPISSFTELLYLGDFMQVCDKHHLSQQRFAFIVLNAEVGATRDNF
jgi:hypothetical protein